MSFCVPTRGVRAEEGAGFVTPPEGRHSLGSRKEQSLNVLVIHTLGLIGTDVRDIGECSGGAGYGTNAISDVTELTGRVVSGRNRTMEE